MEQDIRWKQRLDNLSRVYGLLREAVEDKPIESVSALEKEGAIHRFEHAFELTWKTLKDYLVYVGVTLDIISPSTVINPQRLPCVACLPF